MYVAALFSPAGDLVLNFCAFVHLVEFSKEIRKFLSKVYKMFIYLKKIA